MTLFEYLAIAFSLILSSAAMRLVGGLAYAIEPNRRYWAHLCFVGTTLTTTAIIFWAYWSYHDVVWTLPKFFAALASPGLTYYLAATLIPENPGEVESWYDYFYSVRVRYFSGVSLFAIIIAANATFLIEMPLAHPARISQLSMFLIGCIGASTANARIHAGLGSYAALMTVVGIATVFLRPASLVD